MDLHRRARFYVLETAHDGENTFAETRATSFVVCTLALARAPLRVRACFSCWVGGVKTRHGPPMAMHPAPYALGVLGAVPFVGLTPQARRALGYESVVTPETTARLQIEYGASILSFLGGIHWGLGAIGHSVVRDLPPTPAQLTTRYAWSVTPSLLAWQASLMSSEPRVRYVDWWIVNVRWGGYGLREGGRLSKMVDTFALRADGCGDDELGRHRF